jgi:hypothetical protein
MYELACSCVFYSKNKDILMDDEDEDAEFDHAGEEEEW